MNKKILIIIISASLVIGMISGYFVGRQIEKKVRFQQYVCEVRVKSGSSYVNTITYWVDPAFNNNPKYYTAMQYKSEYPLLSTPGKNDINCSLQ